MMGRIVIINCACPVVTVDTRYLIQPQPKGGAPMASVRLTDRDLRQMHDQGITEDQVRSQIDIFEQGTSFLTLARPCTVGDGVKTIADSMVPDLTSKQHRAALEGRCAKVVPASGAATRMFKTLLRFHHKEKSVHRDDVARMAEAGDDQAREMLSFMDNVQNFAFFGELRSTMERHGLTPDALIKKGVFTPIIEYLLTARGLGYADLPKGLLAFHQYGEGVRTSLEEHLVEAIYYVRDAHNICRLHFTVSPEHQEDFQRFIDSIRPHYEQAYHVQYQITLSLQHPSTDTIAVDMHNQPFREEDGSLLFRPGGHGALIENLNRLGGDILYIKNIDNVIPDRLKADTILWKKILGGYLLEVQEQAFRYLEAMTSGNDAPALLDGAWEFGQQTLLLTPPPDAPLTTSEQKRTFLIRRFNRPFRVCGVVRNAGEPGGGPFWVRGDDGSLSLQIVESAQVDMAAQEQQAIWSAATHFNPVDLVCGVRDFQGNPFDLRQYVDRTAVFISRKSKDGRDLKALELPGLWNGAMADWNTIFVEVPLITFNPVKTIDDLLRAEHQAQ